MQQIVRFDMGDIGWKLILSRTVHFPLAADKNDREGDIWQAADNLVNPCRHASADIWICAFEQQCDISHRPIPL